MKKIVVLISGRGSNMAAIVRACAAEGWPARVASVISSRADAPGLGWAESEGIPTLALEPATFADRDAFDAALTKRIESLGADLVVLAGFMRILGDAFVHHFEGRLLNVHPSLLPAFTGLHTHRRALAAGCKLSGATAHFVTPQLDRGPIIAQAMVPILPTDTEATLAARVLVAEHVLYPRAVRWWVEDSLRVTDGLVTQLGDESQLLT